MWGTQIFTNWIFKNLSWTNSAWGTGHYWEGEVRGYNGANISDAYLGVTAIAGNLPNMYKEYDSDDLSLGCSELSGLVAGNTYYATLTTEMADSFNDGVELWFESEYGDWYGWFGENGDGDPLRYQLFAERFHTTDNRILYW